LLLRLRVDEVERIELVPADQIVEVLLRLGIAGAFRRAQRDRADHLAILTGLEHALSDHVAKRAAHGRLLGAATNRYWRRFCSALDQHRDRVEQARFSVAVLAGYFGDVLIRREVDRDEALEVFDF
jgi:hypothetical protein